MNILEYLAQSGGFLPDEITIGNRSQIYKKGQYSFTTAKGQGVPLPEDAYYVLILYRGVDGKETSESAHNTKVVKEDTSINNIINNLTN